MLQVAARLAAAAAAAVLALGPGCFPSQAVTSEQLLFLEAWRAVDRAYFDKSFNGQNWFKVRANVSLPAAVDRGGLACALISTLHLCSASKGSEPP